MKLLGRRLHMNVHIPDRIAAAARAATGATTTLPTSLTGQGRYDPLKRSTDSSSPSPQPTGLVGAHTFRAIGFTTYLKNGGRLELAQQMADHESPRTTSPYDRRSDQINLDEIERVLI
jgi:hypothetical protein